MSDLPIDLRHIRMIASDVDGTLTDGGMYYASSGETFKRFSVQDGLGVKLLHAAGIEVAFISSDDSPVILERARRLGVTHCYSGVSDKTQIVEALCGGLRSTLDCVAYLGDDLQDYEVMQRVGIAAAVGDGHPLIKEVAQYICVRPGGQGAFRELAEWLIAGRGLTIQEVWQRHLLKTVESEKGV